MLNFNSKGFIAVHVPTQSSFQAMVNKAKEQGYKWGSKPVGGESSYWNKYSIDTVLTFYEDGIIAYTNLDHIRSKNNEILPYNKDIKLPKQREFILLFSIPHIGSSDGTLLIWKDNESGKILLERGCSGKLKLNDFSQRVLKTHAPGGELNDYGRRYLDIVKGLKAMYPDWAGEEALGHIHLVFLKDTDEDQYVNKNNNNGHIYFASNNQNHFSQTQFTWKTAQKIAKTMLMTISKESEREETALVWERIKE